MDADMSGNHGDQLVFFVNGRKVVEEYPQPEQSLLLYLRDNLMLKGTKSGCDQGACGACTVMLSKYDRGQDKISHHAVTACLVPLCSVHGLAVTTVEGIGSVNTKLHPVQEMLVRAHGTQCGFCTPGFIMSMYTLLRNNPEPSMADINRALRGNLCRCTGYRPILDGFKPFAKDFCPMGDQCCQRTSPEPGTVIDSLEGQMKVEYDPTQDPIFPSELQLSPALDQESVTFRSGSVTWIRPTTLQQLLYTKAQYPGSRVVAGNTTIGLERKYKDKHYPVLISVSHVAELHSITMTETGLQLGSAVTLAQIEDYIEDFLRDEKKHNDLIQGGLVAFEEMLRTFAAQQTKNMVSIGGAIASAWSNSDVLPLLCALTARITVASKGRPNKTIKIDRRFCKRAGSTELGENDVILSMDLPHLQKDQLAYSIKHAKRDFDTPLVSLAAVVTLDESHATVKDMRLYYGNISGPVYFAEGITKAISGRPCDDTLPSVVQSLLLEEFSTLELSEDMKSLIKGATWQLMIRILMDARGEQAVPAEEVSALTVLNRGLPQGTRVYEEVPSDQAESDAVGRPIPHRAARQQATGEALFLDDIPTMQDELYLELVTSSVAHGRILSVDSSEALRLPGVVDILTAKDVPGENKFGVMIPDEFIFTEDEVTHLGQVIAGILATSKLQAQKAAKLVHVEYEELECITTIQEAIEKQSYFDARPCMSAGDVAAGMRESDVVVEGEVEIGGQEHFYMETHRALAVPLKEDQEITVHAPVQNASGTQEVVATALNIPSHKVTVLNKRTGGAFGGKETKCMVILPTAVGAFKHKHAVRCMLDRDTDMQLTGGRNPVLAKYKIGVTKDGIIKALDLKYYANSGHTTDVTIFVLEAMMGNFENSYRIPNVSIACFACKTNICSNTALRGFGQPQSVFIAETCITHAAEALGISPKLIRERNMYRVGDPMPYNCSSESLTLERCWAEVLQRSQYSQRLEDVHKYNRENKLRKKGIVVGPMKFGLPIPAAFLNQAQALVNIYLDGSVLIHHGGSEIGQGLHTKMIQVASRALDLPTSLFHIKYRNTDVINNATPTGGSSTTEYSGGAVLDACQKLKVALEPFKAANPEGTWKDWVNAAYNNRVSLSATGKYELATPDLGYDWETGKGRMFGYHSCGAACTEVEIDVLTGHHVVLRTDMVMDVGRSINPAIDIGQIEGAFMQGYGLYALEDLKFRKDGRLATSNAMGYKIPVIANVPKIFNITLLKDAPNPKAVYSSKGIGEPPLLLAYTVVMAMREAIKAYREENSLTGHIQLNSPATPEKVRALCPR